MIQSKRYQTEAALALTNFDLKMTKTKSKEKGEKPTKKSEKTKGIKKPASSVKTLAVKDKLDRSYATQYACTRRFVDGVQREMRKRNNEPLDTEYLRMNKDSMNLLRFINELFFVQRLKYCQSHLLSCKQQTLTMAVTNMISEMIQGQLHDSDIKEKTDKFNRVAESIMSNALNSNNEHCNWNKNSTLSDETMKLFVKCLGDRTRDELTQVQKEDIALEVFDRIKQILCNANQDE